MRPLPDERISAEASCGLAVVALAGYWIAVGGLMFVNTVFLGLGDYGLGSGGWEIYWALWGALYTPVLLAGVVLVGFPRGLRSALALHARNLALLLTILEVDFLLELFPLVFVVYLLVPVCLLERRRRH